MKTIISSYPPATVNFRPEKKSKRSGPFDLFAGIIKGLYVYSSFGGINRKRFVSLVEAYSSGLIEKSDKQLKTMIAGLRLKLHKKGFEEDLSAQSFSLIREIAGRTINMKHYNVQIIGGWVLLNGMVAEMATGEGKTLTATLAAGTAALAGIPVHVISINDYLTARDAESMGPVYRALGLTVGCITHELEPDARREAYQCDVTYCTNKDVVFDYLRDRITLENRGHHLYLQAENLCSNNSKSRRLLQRGLCFAIVDEADSILIDEARTPLIISGTSGGKEEQLFMEQAISIAGELLEGSDYIIDRSQQLIKLTKKGKLLIIEKTETMGHLWTGTIRREDIIQKALAALHFFHRDEHYLVQDNKIHIIDEFTGRLMPDRSWEKGLHQLIELKEGCEMTKQREALAKISYQSFFRRYMNLSGMTGTAMEVKNELWHVYELQVISIPTNRPLIRDNYQNKIFPTEELKWKAVVKRLKQMQNDARPVLTGTRSVAASERVSFLLAQEGIKHRVLNARQDKEEANIIAEAGQPGCITIATNMAGRGTDIILEKSVAKNKGLHVILTEKHDAARIDRQLQGRCARQGDPGSFEPFLSMEDHLLQRELSVFSFIALTMMRFRIPGWTLVGKFAIIYAQKKVEKQHGKIRKHLFKQVEKTGDMLSFSGRSE